MKKDKSTKTRVIVNSGSKDHYKKDKAVEESIEIRKQFVHTCNKCGNKQTSEIIIREIINEDK